jgi:hypothetical protein
MMALRVSLKDGGTRVPSNDAEGLSCSEQENPRKFSGSVAVFVDFSILLGGQKIFKKFFLGY